MSKFDLLVDCLRFPSKQVNQRTHVDTNPSRARTQLVKSGVLKDSYPDFFQIGFRSQAFVDIELKKKADPEELTTSLHLVPGVIMIYTVFGSVDVRCKVVGLDLKAVESVSAQIRKLSSVKHVTTSVIIDETISEEMRANWAQLLLNNQEKIE